MRRPARPTGATRTLRRLFQKVASRRLSACKRAQRLWFATHLFELRVCRFVRLLSWYPIVPPQTRLRRLFFFATSTLAPSDFPCKRALRPCPSAACGCRWHVSRRRPPSVLLLHWRGRLLSVRFVVRRLFRSFACFTREKAVKYYIWACSRRSAAPSAERIP